MAVCKSKFNLSCVENLRHYVYGETKIKVEMAKMTKS